VDVNGAITVRHPPTPDPPVDIFSGDNPIRPGRHCNENLELANRQGGSVAGDQRLTVVEPQLKRTKQYLVALRGLGYNGSSIHAWDLTLPLKRLREREVTQW
jgi:hypothetical protein